MDFDWNVEKNELLRETRAVSFEMVLEEISRGRVLEDMPYPNIKKYPNQYIFVVVP